MKIVENRSNVDTGASDPGELELLRAPGGGCWPMGIQVLSSFCTNMIEFFAVNTSRVHSESKAPCYLAALTGASTPAPWNDDDSLI